VALRSQVADRGQFRHNPELLKKAIEYLQR
jgi:hypothetical protein